MDGLKVVRIDEIALVAGSALMIASVTAESLWLIFTTGMGIGFGGAFQGGLRLILAETPAARRTGVLSTVYIVSYFALGGPAVIAGLLTPTLGLRTVVDAYAVFVALLLAVALLLHLQQQRTKRIEALAALDEPPSHR